MQDYTGYITRSEWRWVLALSLTFILIAFFPYTLISTVDLSITHQQFLGAIHQPSSVAVELAKMVQGMKGAWLLPLQYTPEPHQAAIVQPLYAFLGHVTAWVGLSSPIIVFHLARLAAGFFMYLALYQLSAIIWTKPRSRLIFFILVAVGSGFGWLVAIVTGNTHSLDLSVAQAFPFYSMLINVHYPLTIACLALVAAVMVMVFRPGFTQLPMIHNGGATLILAGLGISLMYGEAFIPLLIAIAWCVVLAARDSRDSLGRNLRWFMWLWIPSLPIAAYYWVTTQQNAVIAAWVTQQGETLPPLAAILSGLGLPLLLALPSLGRAIRRLEADGDRLMILWLGAMLMCAWVIPIGHDVFLAGLMLPVAYFATRAMEGYRLRLRILRRHLSLVMVLMVPVIALSHLFVLFVPIVPLLSYGSSNATLSSDYGAAFQWLQTRARSHDVILASPQVSLWVPVWVGTKVIYGHPRETFAADHKRQSVLAWYRGQDETLCRDLLGLQVSKHGFYSITYVLLGTQELALGTPLCLDHLVFIASFGRVNVYFNPPPRLFQ